MFDGLGYPAAWATYLLSALGLTVVFWRLTRSIRSEDIKKILRGLVVALLFTPVNIGTTQYWLAPAYLVTSYEWLMGNLEVAIRAGVYLIGACIVIVLLLALEAVIKRILH